MARQPDEALTLYFYGEHPAPAELERALAEDADLRRRYDSLSAALHALDALDAPEPRAGLEGRMWARVAPELQRSRSQSKSQRFFSGFQGLPAWAAAAGALVLVVAAAFLAGRSLRPPVSDEGEIAATIRALPVEARDRVLAAALAEHLEASERFLVEVSNGPAAADEERRFAAVLSSANRLYQRAAERSGQRRIAAVLAEIEPLFDQLAGGRPEEAASDLRLAQEWIEGRDLLFKLRVTRNRLKEQS